MESTIGSCWQNPNVATIDQSEFIGSVTSIYKPVYGRVDRVEGP